MEMIGLMHEAEPYGHLVLAGRAVDHSTLAALIGMDGGEVKRAVKELESRGVFSRTDAGMIYSRRMIREENRREKLANNGRKGGNPKLVNKGQIPREDKQQDNQELNLRDKPQKPEAREPLPNGNGGLPPNLAERLWSDGLAVVVSFGIPETKARGLLGKWRKGAGDAKVLALLADAQQRGVSDLVPWMEQMTRSGGPGLPFRRETDEERQKRERQEFLERNYGPDSPRARMRAGGDVE
jgi:hypothetical protein